MCPKGGATRRSVPVEAERRLAAVLGLREEDERVPAADRSHSIGICHITKTTVSQGDAGRAVGQVVVGRLSAIFQDCQVIRRITAVIARPMIGSAIGAPAAAAAALASTPRETSPSVRAW